MAKSKVSTAFVAVLDGDVQTARLVAKGLRLNLQLVKVEAFWKARDAWNKICSNPRIEPYVIVTDWIGTVPVKTSFLARIRANYPRTQIILYSGRVAPETVVRLQNVEGLIDRYVTKEDGIECLLQTAESCFRQYKNNPVLSSVRLYLSRCRNPEVPFTVIGNREYSAVDMYWEMVRGTEMGKVAEEGWQSLLIRGLLEEEGT